MPTPLIYRGLLYVLSNQGILDGYELRTGKEIYRQRISHQGGGFSASPVAADGRIYLSSEDGDIFVVKAGGEFRAALNQSDGRAADGNPRAFGRHDVHPRRTHPVCRLATGLTGFDRIHTINNARAEKPTKKS